MIYILAYVWHRASYKTERAMETPVQDQDKCPAVARSISSEFHERRISCHPILVQEELRPLRQEFGSTETDRH